MVEFRHPSFSESKQIPAIEVQRKIVQDRLQHKRGSCQVWYVISLKWLEALKKFIHLVEVSSNVIPPHPGPIDNSPLLDDTKTDLKSGLFEGVDYEFVSQELWVLLSWWYEVVEGQPIFPKKTYRCGAFVPEWRIEFYKLELFVYNNIELKNGKTLKFNRTDVVKNVRQEIKDAFKVPDDHVTRLWVILDDTTCMLNELATLHESNVDTRQVLYLELKPPGCDWPSDKNNSASSVQKFVCSPNVPITASSSTSSIFSSNYCSSYSSYLSNGSCASESSLGSTSSGSSSPSAKKAAVAVRPYITTRSASSLNAERRHQPSQPGLCGLENIVNTCFMNAIIQCLSNTPCITLYFLSDRHLLDINESNEFGMSGLLANAFHDLLCVLWSGTCQSTVPSDFKSALSSFAPQFAGYQQHDMQEFLTILLDGLHEDLNRALTKPYTERKDYEGQEDYVVAEDVWSTYKLINDSIIVDTFHGLLKSRVICPECEKVSITFDPFVHLSLPLPLKDDLALSIIHVPYCQAQGIVEYKLLLSSSGTVLDLCYKLSDVTGIKPDHLVVAKVSEGCFQLFYDIDDPLSSITTQDIIFVYDLPCGHDDITSTVVPVICLDTSESESSDLLDVNNLFGIPFLLALPRHPISCKKLYVLVSQRLTRQFKFNFEGCDGSAPSFVNGADADDKIAEECQRLFSMYFLNTNSLEPGNKRQIQLYQTIFLNEVFGTETILLEWKRQAKVECYKELSSQIIDTTEHNKSANYKPDILDCINLFTMTEKLGVDNAWYCPVCKRKQQATKKIDLWKLPPVLIFHLKRFSFEKAKRDKVDSMINFPVDDLQLEKFVINRKKEDVVYDLICVGNHYGSAGSGHCTAFVKNRINSKWYSCDDSKVIEIKKERVVSAAAYVLFYMRREAKPLVETPASVSSSGSYIQPGTYIVPMDSN